MKKLHQVYYGFLKFPTLCLSARCQVLKARSFSFGLRQKASSLQELVLPLVGDYNLVTRIPAYTQYTALLQEAEHFDVIEVFTFEDHPEMDACTDYSRTHPWHCSLRCVGHETLGHPHTFPCTFHFSRHSGGANVTFTVYGLQSNGVATIYFGDGQEGNTTSSLTRAYQNSGRYLVGAEESVNGEQVASTFSALQTLQVTPQVNGYLAPSISVPTVTFDVGRNPKAPWS